MTASLLRRAGRGCAWPAVAGLAALIPFLPALSGARVFYARDLGAFFWGRFLWLRRAWDSGEWPLWDPYVGAGQAAHADALHQMFLPPSILVRMLGSETQGFNLWVATPFPLAAVGTWLFLARRASGAGAALGAVAFAACGPVVASGNFPNLSWSVAFLPWVLWAVDLVLAAATCRRIAVLAVLVALQCLSGEPVTFFTTAVLAVGYAAAFSGQARGGVAERVRRMAAVGTSLVLGLALSCVQLVPMVAAAVLASRGDAITPDAWSLRPTALLETLWPHLYGDYFTTQSLTEVPWMPLMYTGREPLLFSIYLGVPLLALAMFGIAGTGDRRWRLFWAGAAIVSLVASFGSYTPIYPILRDHVPPFGTFRFPVKYIYVAVLAVAVGAACGWDRLRERLVTAPDGDPRDAWRRRRAWASSIGFAMATALFAACFAAACMYFTESTSTLLDGYADLLNSGPVTGAGQFMIRTVPLGAARLMAVAFAAAGLLLVIARYPRATTGASWMFAGLVVIDLLVAASTVNPTFDAEHFAEPEWLALTRADPDARFYVGGKSGGTLNAMDFDASRGFVNKRGLTGSASRATLSLQAAFYPSAWRARELLSYDLPVLWPAEFSHVIDRFAEATQVERDRMLDRTGVRYRVLPQRRAGSRAPLIALPQFMESFLFDWGTNVRPRVFVVPNARVVPDWHDQVDALFADGWDVREMVLLDRELPTAGLPGAPTDASARMLVEESNRVTAEAAAPGSGGYVVLLDSYSTDWHVTVDGQPATLARANGLFRATRIPPGMHQLEYRYRPRGLAVGATVSFLTAVSLAAISIRRRSRRSIEAPAPQALSYGGPQTTRD
ncbi:MAG: YfhO family protein [Vicinamibacterales bacterium]